MRIQADPLAAYTLAEAIKYCKGITSISEKEQRLPIPHIATDSREVEPGDIFIALRGENFDGHAFIKAARAKGAAYIIGEIGREDGGRYIGVSDTTRALGDIAAGYLDRVSPEIVAAVTGSVGKTTTKEYLAALLEVRYKTHKTAGNFNNLIGLPLTILTMPYDCRALVLEAGMSAAGEIDRLAEIARPSIGIITVIGNSHIEHLGSRKNICAAKCELLGHIRQGGRLYIPEGEPLLDRVGSERFETVRVSVRGGSRCRIGAENIKTEGETTVADLIGDGLEARKLRFPTLGLHCLADAMLAVEAVRDLGYNAEEIRQGLAGYKTVGMRQSFRRISKVTLIEDCYNASPESMRASLDVLASIALEGDGRRAALLGDMYELGEDSERLHYEVGRYAAEMLDILFTLGKHSLAIAEGAKAAGMDEDRIFSFGDISLYEECGKKIAEVLGSGDILLAKASRATAAERAISAFEEKANKD